MVEIGSFENKKVPLYILVIHVVSYYVPTPRDIAASSFNRGINPEKKQKAAFWVRIV